MTLARQSLRDAAKTALEAISGLAVSGPRAFMRNLDELPAAEVSTTDESVEVIDADGGVERTITLQITLYAKGEDGTLDDVLDALAEQAAAALNADATLQAIAGEDSFADGVAASFEMGAAGDTPVGHLTLTYIVTVHEG